MRKRPSFLSLTTIVEYATSIKKEVFIQKYIIDGWAPNISLQQTARVRGRANEKVPFTLSAVEIAVT